MKMIILAGILLTPMALFAGSLGKYYVEDPRSQSIRTPDVQPLKVDPRLVEKLEQSREAKRKEQLFYSGFERRVKDLSSAERREWLSEYREKLKVASNREQINKQEVTHYTRLIAIIQRNIQ